MLTYGRDASLSYILGTSIDCRTHNVYVFSINDIRRKKKITNKSKVEINKHTKKILWQRRKIHSAIQWNLIYNLAIEIWNRKQNVRYMYDRNSLVLITINWTALKHVVGFVFDKQKYAEQIGYFIDIEKPSCLFLAFVLYFVIHFFLIFA